MAVNRGSLLRTVFENCNRSMCRGAVYRPRKQTVEPVFGIIKSVMGFRQFSLRGLGQVQGEWRLVCMEWNGT
jgi:hypothetical protein